MLAASLTVSLQTTFWLIFLQWRNTSKLRKAQVDAAHTAQHTYGVYHASFRHLVLEKNLYWAFRVFGFRDFEFWDFCILVHNINHFRALGSPFQDGRRSGSSILNCRMKRSKTLTLIFARSDCFKLLNAKNLSKTVKKCTSVVKKLLFHVFKKEIWWKHWPNTNEMNTVSMKSLAGTVVTIPARSESRKIVG